MRGSNAHGAPAPRTEPAPRRGSISGSVRPSRWLGSLLTVCLGSPNRRLRRLAVVGLGWLGNPDLVPSLVPALQDASPLVRRAADQVLTRAGWAPAGVEERVWSAAARDDWEAIPACGFAGATALARLLASPDPELQHRARDVLQSLGPEAAAVLVDRARLGLRPDRVNALRALATVGGDTAIQVLTDALHDRDWAVCVAAAEALASLGPPAVPPLTRALKQRDWAVRQLAAEALGTMGDGTALEPLLSALGTHDRGVRRTVARALGGLRERGALNRLLAALRDPDSTVRRAAAEALGRIGERNAVPPLLELLRDPDWDVRAAAVESLGHLGDPQALPALRQRLHAVGRLREEDPGVLQALAAAIARIAGSPRFQRDLPVPGVPDQDAAAGLPIPGREDPAA
ncbi:MAG: HEAT repeat domain-containing protein [Armatimonadetes bacterium]|nr:HEAT repeat domain-containing protein [Armatimonadota bacterium]